VWAQKWPEIIAVFNNYFKKGTSFLRPWRL